MKLKSYVLSIVLIAVLLLSGCVQNTNDSYNNIGLENIPVYDGSPYVALNGNKPYFTEEEYSYESYEEYGELDYLGRCTTAVALVGRDIMPTEERGAIGQIKPTGWQTVKYDWVDGKYLYNRCHLIGFQLTGENANERNLITGTRYMNVEGMLPFENMVADYVKETDNHVLLRVTPVFKEQNLVANGVVMEALSMEDKGSGICFNVYCYNVQPGVSINYASGKSEPDNSYSTKETNNENEKTDYVINISSKKVHKPSCSSVKDIKENNKGKYYGYLSDLLSDGYSACKSCNPK